jgi:hypothetical protein
MTEDDAYILAGQQAVADDSKVRVALINAQSRANVAAMRASGMGGSSGASGSGAPATSVLAAGEPASEEILGQTGMSLSALLSITGRSAQLPRDSKLRAAAMLEAQKFAKDRGVDVSTLPSQYKAYNDVLASNINRMNRTQIAESEVMGTIGNLQSVVKDQDLSKLRFANVAKIWAGQEVNDPLAQQYATHLQQLRNQLTAYNGATQGRSGNNLTVEDTKEANRMLKDGVSKGSLEGLATAIKNETAKMNTVMGKSVDMAHKQVWDLFGVGGNYKPKFGESAPVPAVVKTYNPATGKFE